MKKHLKQCLIVPLLLVASFLAYAQGPNARAVTGRVLDENQRPLPHATVTLHYQADSVIGKMGVSNELGDFVLANLRPGEYFIRAAAMGHLHTDSEVIFLSDSIHTVELPPLILHARTDSLDAVDVVSAQPLIDMRADRMVVNVDQLLSAQGRSAWELIQQAPGVLAGNDGAVSILGTDNALVIVDGKQVHLSGSELVEHLQSMPADHIHQVEVISRPSAKYDAAGIGGIINLRTKKGMTNGFSGSLTLAARQGRYFNSTNNLAINWKSDRTYVFADLSYALANPLIKLDQRHEYKSGAGAIETLVEQRFISESTTSTPALRTGLDYTTGPTAMGVTYHVNLKGFPAQKNTSFSEIFSPQQQLLATNEASRTRELRNPIHSITAYLDQQLRKPGSSLSLSADYLDYHRPLRYHLTNTLVPAGQTSGGEHTLIQQNIPSKINVYGIKADYRLPLTETAALEAGVKSTHMEMDNDAVFGVHNPNTSQYEPDVSRSTHYLFEERISAAYVDYSQQWGETWALQAGLRLEQTKNQGKEIRRNETFRNRRTHFFPSVMLQFRPHSLHGLSLSYNQRIDRPNYEFLIPFAFYTDLLYHQAGNPRLLPEISGSVSLSYTFASQLNASFTYTQASNPFLLTLSREPGNAAMAVGFGNIDDLNTYGLNISYMKAITSWYSLMTSLTGQHEHYTGALDGEQLDAGRLAAMGQLVNQLRLPRTWSLEVSATYVSSMQDGPFSISDPMSRVDITLSKQVLKNQGSLRLQVVDLFDDYHYTTQSFLAALTSLRVQRLDSRMFGLSFSYRFGRIGRQAPRQPESATTEEAARL